ncbi:MAG: dockerin type I repeat-containing protein, partial [Ruminococcus sp.]|nr:dockerin type I repeat-containing protein [Ruminococcus sp.]
VFDIRVKLDTPAPKDVIGDVTGDGKVTIDDATRLLAYLAEFAVPNVDRILRLGDMNCDGRIDVNDVTAIQRYLAGF